MCNIETSLCFIAESLEAVIKLFRQAVFLILSSADLHISVGRIVAS